jgi:acyl carrier protein
MNSTNANSLAANMNIRERFQAFIEERFLAGAGLDQIEPDESLLENGVVDSTGVLELIEFLERTFQVKILDEELIPDNLDSVDNLVAFVERKIGLKIG